MASHRNVPDDANEFLLKLLTRCVQTKRTLLKPSGCCLERKQTIINYDEQWDGSGGVGSIYRWAKKINICITRIVNRDVFKSYHFQWLKSNQIHKKPAISKTWTGELWTFCTVSSVHINPRKKCTRLTRAANVK